jgi:hypothetical protein
VKGVDCRRGFRLGESRVEGSGGPDPALASMKYVYGEIRFRIVPQMFVGLCCTGRWQVQKAVDYVCGKW